MVVDLIKKHMRRGSGDSKMVDEKRLVLSGTIHMSYYIGQKLDESLLKKETEEFMPSAKRRKRQSAATGNRVGTTTTRSSVTLKDLVDNGLLMPGKDLISVSYKGSSGIASLTLDGTIEYEGQEFQSATAFSIYFKRRITPSKQGDDGWKSVFYGGQCLDVYRKRLLEMQSVKAAAAKTPGPEAKIKIKLRRPTPKPQQANE